MTSEKFNYEKDFVVGEEKWMNYFLSILFLCIFIYGFKKVADLQFVNTSYLDYVYFLFLAPAVFFFIKGRRNFIYIRINKNGIYQTEKLVTNWENFIHASIAQEQKTFSIKDNFILLVEYRKYNSDKGFRRKIPLTNTQNKSEEDVLAAVKFFWKEFNKNII